MSLTDAGHLAAAATCVAAAGVMVVRSRHPVVRRAHAVLVVTMMLGAFAMHSWLVLLGCGAALLTTAAVLALRADPDNQACAVDLTACASLVALMAVPLLLAGHGGTAEPAGGGGLHAAVHGAVPGAHDHQVGLTLLAAGAVLAWFVLRRRIASTAAESAAPLLMMGGMAVMIAL